MTTIDDARTDAPTARPSDVAWGMSRWVTFALGVLVLGVSVFLVYWPATDGPFIFDDQAALTGNTSIRHLWPLVGSGKSGGPLNAPETTPLHGRPLVNLSFAVNYYFGQLEPFGYRVVHIVIHLLTAILLWAIVARTLRLDFFQGKFDSVAEPLSFAAALVWALHPVNTESVVYVTQRTELMMGMFYLATLYCSIRYWATENVAARATCLALVTFTCLSGMLCKEMMASAPVMVLLFERTFVAGSFRRALRRSWPLYARLALGWVAVLALNIHGPRTPSAGFGLGVAAHEWWFTQTKVLFLYLKLAIWPWPLVIHYEVAYLKTVAQAWPWLLAAGLLAIGTVVLVWRRSSVGFVATWFFAVLSPTLVIPLIAETAAERRMYVPLAALVPLFIVGAYAVLRQAWQLVARRAGWKSIRNGSAGVFFVATIALAIGFGYLSSHRLVAYQDRLSLWQDAVARQPHNPLTQINLGIQFAEAGRFPEAILHLEEGVRLDPDSYMANYNLAWGFEVSGRSQDAIERYHMTLRLRPDDPASHCNLAHLLEDAGYTLRASEHYRHAIAAQPDFYVAHTDLGCLLLNGHRVREAIKSFEVALRGPEDLVNYLHLAWAYSRANRRAEAIRMAEKALALARSQNDTSSAEAIDAFLESLGTQRSTR